MAEPRLIGREPPSDAHQPARRSGNVYDADGLPTTNDILGQAGGLGVPNVRITLIDGQTIGISGLADVTFTKK